MDDLLEAVELLAKLAIEGVHEHLQDVLLALADLWGLESGPNLCNKGVKDLPLHVGDLFWDLQAHYDRETWFNDRMYKFSTPDVAFFQSFIGSLISEGSRLRQDEAMLKFDKLLHFV